MKIPPNIAENLFSSFIYSLFFVIHFFLDWYLEKNFTYKKPDYFQKHHTLAK